MKDSPELEFELDSLRGVSGPQGLARQHVVAWQMMRGACNAIVGAINQGSCQKDARARQRHELHLKAVLVGHLYEMDLAFDQWATQLNKDGLLDGGMKAAKKEFKLRTKVLQSILSKTRNHAFHFSFMFDPNQMAPDQLADIYEEVDAIPVDHINAMWRAACQLGDLMAAPAKGAAGF